MDPPVVAQARPNNQVDVVNQPNSLVDGTPQLVPGDPS